MNEEMKAPDLLRSAARLIERAVIQLDTGSTTCEHCHVPKFKNLLHAKAYQQLTDQPHKLTNLAGMLEEGGMVPAKGLGRRVVEARQRNIARRGDETSAFAVDTTAEALGQVDKRRRR